jgi:hypothetical protein
MPSESVVFEGRIEHIGAGARGIQPQDCSNSYRDTQSGLTIASYSEGISMFIRYMREPRAADIRR